MRYRQRVAISFFSKLSPAQLKKMRLAGSDPFMSCWLWRVVRPPFCFSCNLPSPSLQHRLLQSQAAFIVLPSPLHECKLSAFYFISWQIHPLAQRQEEESVCIGTVYYMFYAAALWLISLSSAPAGFPSIAIKNLWFLIQGASTRARARAPCSSIPFSVYPSLPSHFPLQIKFFTSPTTIQIDDSVNTHS